MAAIACASPGITCSSVYQITKAKINDRVGRDASCVFQKKCPDSLNKSYFFRSVSNLSSVHTTNPYQTSSLKLNKNAFAVCAVIKEAAPSIVQLQEVEFVWAGNASEVLLTGSFLNWETKIQLKKLENGSFSVKQKLKPGVHTYKYIVDGEWQHHPDFPSVPDGSGGFNNAVTVDINPSDTPPVSEKNVSPPKAAKQDVPPPPSPPAENVKAEKASPVEKAPAKPPGKAGKKAAVVKPIAEAMAEDIIPALTVTLSKEDISELELYFEDNQLRGSYLKNKVRYQFCAYFPDGVLDGPRGFSLTSRGNPFSTVEPFLIDERKVTTDLLVFWVQKRLFAQKILSLN